ncbi:MAG: DcaP family trimeric outer membrane transporter [Candidatus Amulumruptor caecigallinarius]|nr:DcaP family trimeric outer membrane transporter [Candidatus Amulumruptor caecigallinarius]
MKQTLRLHFMQYIMKIAHALILISVSIAFTGIAANASSILPDSLTYPEEINLDKLIRNTHIFAPSSEVRQFSDTTATPQPQNPVSHKDSLYKLIGRFYADQFRNFQDPKAPYFMFMSKNADLAMGIGGVVRLRGWYGWNGALNANGFSPYLIPIPKDPADKHELNGTPAGTALYFTLMAHRDNIGYFNAYVEGNFNGYQHTDFKLKKAYVTLNDLTIGYASSTFCDPGATAPTIDGAGPNGKIDRSNLLVRYMHTLKDRWIVGASFEFPKSYIDAVEGYSEKCTDYIPDIAAMAQYQWDSGLSHIRVSGLLRVMTYRDLLEQKNKNVVGWGAMLSGRIKIFRPLSLYFSGAFGHGQGSYQGDLNIGNYDLVPYLDNPSKLYAPKSVGLTFGARYFIRNNIYACLAYGYSRYFRKENVSDNEYKYGMYGAVNIFWDIAPRIQIGAEYLIGHRANFNGMHAGADRVDALFQFSF